MSHNNTFNQAINDIHHMCIQVYLEHSLTLSYVISLEYAEKIFAFITSKDLGCFALYYPKDKIATFRVSHPICYNLHCKQCSEKLFQSFHIMPQ